MYIFRKYINSFQPILSKILFTKLDSYKPSQSIEIEPV